MEILRVLCLEHEINCVSYPIEMATLRASSHEVLLDEVSIGGWWTRVVVGNWEGHVVFAFFVGMEYL